MSAYTALRPLFIKPLYYPGSSLYARYFRSLRDHISFRSFDLDRDLNMVHQWVNMPYALPFWQFAATREKVFDVYYNIQRSADAHSFVGLLNDEVVCQVDVYRVLIDEINAYTHAGINDCGFHLLMAPNETPVPGLSSCIIAAFLDFYFSFTEAGDMYAEPDVLNLRSNMLVQKAGFRLQQQIPMSYKSANLYRLGRDDFYNAQQMLNL